MPDITTLLQAAGAGDDHAEAQVITLLYDTLRDLARSRLRRSGDMTLLETEALVHECYLRLQRAGRLRFDDRRHFYAYASKVMRTIVIDMARSRQAQRHGGDVTRLHLDTGIADALPAIDDDLLRVHEALEELASVDERLASVVEMRYFGGLSEAEVAECLGVTERTVQRDWRKARLFLCAALR